MRDPPEALARHDGVLGCVRKGDGGSAWRSSPACARLHCAGLTQGGECAGEVCLDLVKLFGGSSCTDSVRMKEFTARVSTAVFAAAASGVPSELRATCMGKSGV